MNFRQVRKKIKTIGNVKKITKAMQMVAAVKMRKSIEAAMEGKLYRTTLDTMLRQVLSKIGSDVTTTIPFMQKNNASRNLCFVVTANKGLCGNFNANILKFLVQKVDFKTTDFIVVGKKGAELIRRLGGTIIADFSDTENASDGVSSVFTLIKEKYSAGTYKEVTILYNNFISALSYSPTMSVILPIQNVRDIISQDTSTVGVEYLIEPAPEAILPLLVEDVIKENIRASILESQASEQSARMMAMKMATDSAGDLINGLTMLSNKLRQQSITYELLDIISAQSGAQ